MPLPEHYLRQVEHMTLDRYYREKEAIEKELEADKGNKDKLLLRLEEVNNKIEEYLERREE